MGTAVALLLVAYLPGAVMFRLPVATRARRGELPADERLFWCVVLSVAWSCGVALGLAAIGIYNFAVLLWLNAAAALLAAAAARFDLRLRDASPPGLAVVLPVLLVALGVLLYFPPAEYVMGGKDPGTYMNE